MNNTTQDNLDNNVKPTLEKETSVSLDKNESLNNSTTSTTNANATNTNFDNTSSATQNNQIVSTSAQSALSQDSKNMALLVWLGCLFTGFIVPLIMMLVKKDDAYVQSQAKEALNMIISAIFAYIATWVMMIVFGFIFAPLALIPLLFMIAIGFGVFIFCILGAVKTSSGDNFRVPFIVRLIK